MVLDAETEFGTPDSDPDALSTRPCLHPLIHFFWQEEPFIIKRSVYDDGLPIPPESRKSSSSSNRLPCVKSTDSKSRVTKIKISPFW